MLEVLYILTECFPTVTSLNLAQGWALPGSVCMGARIFVSAPNQLGSLGTKEPTTIALGRADSLP